MRDLAFMRKDQHERPRLNVPADFVPYKSKPAWAPPDPLDEADSRPCDCINRPAGAPCRYPEGCY